MKNKQEMKKYACTLHPYVISIKPNKCPMCNMDLIEKTFKKPEELNEVPIVS